MSNILGIDPGTTESGYTLIDADTCRPIVFGKVHNDTLLDSLVGLDYDRLSIEMIASYGMPVGKEVFETCVWIGRFQQRHIEHKPYVPHGLVYRKEVKLHHCHSNRAKDSNITQALVDRFASGVPNKGKGTKAAPGWFYGFAGDVWQAYALAVCTADQPDLSLARTS